MTEETFFFYRECLNHPSIKFRRCTFVNGCFLWIGNFKNLEKDYCFQIITENGVLTACIENEIKFNMSITKENFLTALYLIEDLTRS